MPADTRDPESLIADVRKLLLFGITPESLPAAVEETLGLTPTAARRLVSSALQSEEVTVVPVIALDD